MAKKYNSMYGNVMVMYGHFCCDNDHEPVDGMDI